MAKNTKPQPKRPKPRRLAARATVQVDTISNVGRDVNIAGGNMTVQRSGLGAADLRRYFQPVYAEIDARTGMLPTDQDDLRAEVKELQAAVAKAAKKNQPVEEGFLAARFRNIARIAPDLLDVIVATVANPLGGLGVAFRKIADRAKEETSARP